MEVDNLVLRRGITHLFLPKRTPGAASTNLAITEEFILNSATLSVSQAIQDQDSSFPELDNVGAMLNTWKWLQPTHGGQDEGSRFVKKFIVSASSQEPFTIPIYIRKQNCTLLIQNTQDHIRMEPFRAALPSQLVMSNMGAFSITFPESCQIIQNKDILTKEIFAKTLYDLTVTDCGISIPTIETTRQGNDRDVTEPFLITEWIASILSPVAATSDMKPTSLIYKKVRDQVTLSPQAGSSNHLPFRRSGIWLSIKVAIQLKLLKVFKNDQNTARFIYKLLLLRILADVCKTYHDRAMTTDLKLDLDLDLAAQMLAKVGRRVQKIGDLSRPASAQLGLLKHQILEHVQDVVSNLAQAMRMTCFPNGGPDSPEKFEAYLVPPRFHASYIKALNHSIPYLSSYKEPGLGVETSSQELKITPELQASLDVKRYPTFDAIIAGASSLTGKCLLNERIWLHDTESFMKTHLMIEQDTEKISQLVEIYVKHALPLYPGNPIGISQMILVVLYAVEVLDKIATNNYPLLKDYQSGINCNAFDCLLLPHQEDMKLLNDALHYFSNRNKAASKKLGIITKTVTPASFAVEYALRDAHMIGVRDGVLRDTKQQINKLLADIHKVRDLQEEIDRTDKLDCQKFPSPCRHCMLLDVQSHIRRRITLFERPLPRDEMLRNAITFEELIPQPISDLRNCLAILKFSLLEEPMFRPYNTKLKIWYKWIEYKNLIDYLPWSTRFVRKTGSVFNLGSTHLNTLSKHNKLPDIPKSSEKSFVLENGMECIYGYSQSYSFPKTQPITELRLLCAFQIKETNNPGPYLSLQGYLQWYDHTQNEVIASQHASHADLFLDEYIAFGSIRAGPRIQLRNLYREIASKLISLEEEPVLALALQTIWQVGPRSDSTGEREAHVDFEDADFCSAFLSMLRKWVKEHGMNYNHPLILLTAVVITMRILEQNENVVEPCYILLKEWRAVIKKWTNDIEAEIRKDQDVANVRELQRILLLARVASALSYGVSASTNFSKIMRDREDICEWFHSICIINQDYTQDLVRAPRLSKFSQMLVRLGQHVALRLRLEDHVFKQSIVREALILFVSEKWSKAVDCATPKLPGFPNNSNLVLLKYTENRQSSSADSVPPEMFNITFDFVLGTFLVNGHAVGRLPTMATKAPIFVRYFREHTSLRVQKESDKVLRTATKFYGRHYEFRMTEDEDVIIKEILDNGPVLTLLGHEKFRNIFAPSFVDNYTHWFNERNKILYFRRLSKHESDYESVDEYKLLKSGVDDYWKLEDATNGAFVMSIKSVPFRDMWTALAPLELSHNINVLVRNETNGTWITAHLPRYNLRFSLVERRLECMEYPGYHLVGEEGKDDTLIGLERGLLLWNGSKRLRIISNGDIQFRAGSKPGRQLTTIKLEDLREPAYFVYEYDQVLRRLVASKSKQAWLHLAALHAVTSCSLPDPFTGITGTEMAVRILQSGFVWSSSPYDEDCLRILKFIKNLAPQRSYFGHHGKGTDNRGAMEVTRWPSGLPSMAAFDGFDIIIDKLIEDSQQLKTLYYGGKPGKPNVAENRQLSSSQLRLRSYFRHLRSYNQGASLGSSYFPSALRGLLSTAKTSEIIVSNTESSAFQTKAVSSVAWCIRTPLTRANPLPRKEGNILNYLSTKYLTVNQGFLVGSIQDIFKLDFRANWFALYEMARKKQKSEEDKHKVSVILCAMAYKNEPIGQVSNLHYISTFADRLDFPSIPRRRSFEDFQKSTYQQGEVVIATFRAILLNPVSAKPGVNFYDGPDSLQRRSTSKQTRAETIATFLGQTYGSSANIPDTEDVRSMLAGFNYTYVMREINSKLEQWYLLAEPKKFAEDVQRKLDQILKSLKYPQPNIQDLRAGAASPVIHICKPDWKCKIQLAQFLKGIQFGEEPWGEAKECYETGRISNSITDNDINNKEDFTNKKMLYSSLEQNITMTFTRMVLETSNGRILRLTGLCPRTDPTTLLRRLAEEPEGDAIIKTIAGALAVIWTHLKRLNRCLLYQSSNQTVELERELENEGHTNWNPSRCSEWLLLELELDIMIRSVQVEVAVRMMRMPDGGNGVMQLNMGEGKTTVIVPMLCSALALGDKLCRVTVLGSIFNTNHATLSFAIGGLLNRRIYTIPCKRDMAIGEELADRIQRSYQECLEMKGVVLTLPEYRLSFRLLAYDKILKGDPHLGLKLQQTERWLRENARDVLDEADELLNVKYQLIYTIGNQTPVDGGDIRWTTCQKLLKIVQLVGKELYQKYGSDCIEFNPEEFENNPHQFTPVRLLEKKIHTEFVFAVADRFLSEIDWTTYERTIIKPFFTHEIVARQQLAQMGRMCEESTEQLNKVLLTSGYLRRGVLTLGLSKRWRVEYGVDERKSSRQMAVPFRAKDVAAEKTEFGHPDLAILLTHLSYYYSGLTDSQLDYTFKLIKTRKGADAIYSFWIQQIPSNLVPSSLSTLHGLNLKDSGQRAKLYRMLRRHTSVIDFWLAHKVFPKEAREFPAKLVMTAWDLCFERQRHPTTGFSGTNDTSILLPLPITQQDLPSLLDTNKEMERVLLQPENQVRRNLEMGVSCKEILNMMREDNLTILIDAGAIMLECSNEQLATLWLDVNPELEAIIYFSDDNELMVKSRSSRGQGGTASDAQFELSSFKGRLDKCGVFLDDQHTRGTDIKFPLGVQACVTVGGNMRRDKLIQASMRMRKLGRGHSVSFYLSHEASGKIKDEKGNGSQIVTEDLLGWVTGNSKSFNEDGLLYWSIAGKNYAQRLAAEDVFASQAIPSVLGEQCKDIQVSQLIELYGRYVKYEFLVKIIPEWFELVRMKLANDNNNNVLPATVVRDFCKIRDGVVARCLQHIPKKTQLFGSNMEEEQERELEPEKEMEIEEEAQIEREKASPAIHKMNRNVEKFVLNGKPLMVIDGIERLCDVFKRTSCWREVQPEGWGDEVFATTDFITVVSDRNFYTDFYLRPIEYFVVGKPGIRKQVQVLLLSPFEVNLLIPSFRGEGKVASQLRMFSARRSETQETLLNESGLLLPRGSEQFHISEESRINAALLLASGSLYFKSMAEQRAFTLFVSLAPPPWTEEENEAFDSGLITKSMFMLPEYRRGDRHGERTFAFSRDPSPLIRGILACRHPVQSDMAHVIRLVNDKVYVTFR